VLKSSAAAAIPEYLCLCRRILALIRWFA